MMAAFHPVRNAHGYWCHRRADVVLATGYRHRIKVGKQLIRRDTGITMGTIFQARS